MSRAETREEGGKRRGERRELISLSTRLVLQVSVLSLPESSVSTPLEGSKV